MINVVNPFESEASLTSLQKEYSVSEIAYNIKNTLEQTFDKVRIRGEISGAKLHTSGHLYCALKDTQSILDAVCWRGVVNSLNFRPEDGMEVITTGRITTYPGRSKYQLVIEKIEIAGEGALLKILEKRKKKLALEGLFDQEKKKSLPFLPRLIGIITSPTGAVIQDILHRLRDRCPTPVLLWPVLVQGEGAAEQIAKAIQGFNSLTDKTKMTRPDLLIVARGGGSLEDLWPFNEEIVVRAAANSSIPLISAIGHETDTTLIDYVSDWRAPTPTAAAERAVPVRSDLYQFVQESHHRISNALNRTLEENTQRFDDRFQRFEQLTNLCFERWNQNLITLGQRLRHPKDQIEQAQERIGFFAERLNRVSHYFLKEQQNSLNQLISLLESFSYHSILKRGFCAVKDHQQHLISSKNEAQHKDILTLLFYDGEVNVRLLGNHKRLESTVKITQPAKPTKSFPTNQGSLW